MRLLRVLFDACKNHITSTFMEFTQQNNSLTSNLSPITFMIWNVQGAGNREFLAALREIIRINNPSVLALVETHMGGDQAECVATMLKYDGHTCMDAQGFSGGIWVALCNGDWSMRFSNAHVKHLPAIQSDHCPIFISPNGFVPLDTLARPFRFQACWLLHENFETFVKDKWKRRKNL
ncbi:Protein FixB [Bienertia sinuspersici]